MILHFKIDLPAFALLVTCSWSQYMAPRSPSKVISLKKKWLMLNHDSWWYVHHCRPRVWLCITYTFKSCIIISWIEIIMALLNPEKLLHFSQNLITSFPFLNSPIFLLSYYSQGLLGNLLLINTFQLIMSWKTPTFYAHLLLTPVTGFYPFMPYIMYN